MGTKANGWKEDLLSRLELNEIVDRYDFTAAYASSWPAGSSRIEFYSNKSDTVNPMENKAKDDSRTIRLLDLPLEIRNEIYRLALVQSDSPLKPNVRRLFSIAEGHERTLDPYGVESTLSLARTCSQIHDEAIAVYYGKNNFEFDNIYDLYVFLYMVSWECRRRETTKGARYPQKDIWKAKGMSALRKVRGSENLNLMIQEVGY
ncbi:hypothetical protein BKA64DRAFT_721823 [Cadophora sp. MPI-SDFR-AT-0126]|nr:hypothetical protein BKA64DRAFT_721823 [Leotiomycetes sp. MPI-SDFR-AT-0126]